MNIFILDEDPERAAFDQCNKHVVKMPLETAQLLCTAIAVRTKQTTPYKPTHKNHPCAVWARETSANFDWLVVHGLALCEAYTKEYGKVHKSQEVIEWARNNKPLNFIRHNLTPHVQCMPEKYMVFNNPVAAYRAFYLGEKADFAKWNKRNVPEWFKVVTEV